MTDDERSLREALAAGPTPGPWHHEEWGSRIIDRGVGSSQLLIAQVAVNTFRDQGRHNADYIAACSPDRVERLLVEVERLRAELATAQQDAVRYRWMRGDSCPDHSVRWTQWEVRCWRAPFWTGDLRHIDLDEEIDESMRKEGGQ